MSVRRYCEGLTFCVHRPAAARPGPPGFSGLSRLVRAFGGFGSLVLLRILGLLGLGWMAAGFPHGSRAAAPGAAALYPREPSSPSQPYGVDAAFMSLELRGSGIHAIWSGTGGSGVTEAYSRGRATSARASGSGGVWISAKRRVSWGNWGFWEKLAVYSAQVIRQVRILPDRLWARREGRVRHAAKGRGGWGACWARAADQARCTDTDKERGALARNATVRAEGHAGPVF
jgi:hypothetical protein